MFELFSVSCVLLDCRTISVSSVIYEPTGTGPLSAAQLIDKMVNGIADRGALT